MIQIINLYYQNLGMNLFSSNSNAINIKIRYYTIEGNIDEINVSI